MSNRIDPVQNGITQKPGKQTTETASAPATRPEGPERAQSDRGKAASGKDTVVLTERGQLLARLEKTVASLPDVDVKRVEAVKADIASGNYRIDVDNIADILLRTERDLGAS